MRCSSCGEELDESGSCGWGDECLPYISEDEKRLRATVSDERAARIVAMSATLAPVSRPRKSLSGPMVDSLARLQREAELAHKTFVSEVVYALETASFSEVSKATGLSTNTLQRWKREAGK